MRKGVTALLAIAACIMFSVMVLASNEAAAAPASKTGYTIGTAGSSGAYYIISAAMAKEIDDKAKVMNLIVQPTKGASENINLVDAGEMDFGWATSGVLYYSFHGTGYQKDEGPKQLAGVMSMHNSTGQMMVRKGSGIDTYADLKGKRVCVGTPSASVYDMSTAIMRAHGVDPTKDITAFYLTQDEGAQKLGDGDIDATFILAAHPTAVFTNLAAAGDFKLLQSDPKLLKVMIEAEMPYASIIELPANIYKGTEEPIYTLQQKACVFARPELPEEVVYDFVKTTINNWDAIKVGHNTLVDLDTKAFFDVPIPMHPGAERYFKEVGLIK
jgi:TRAP transporter TAXI family solute receptor